MPKEMTLPKIGVNMAEAVICEWKVRVGDKVNKDDLIMVAETDKALQEIYATESGIVEKLYYEEGETVECHKPIILLRDENEEVVMGESTPAKEETPAKEPDEPAAPVPPIEAQEPSSIPSDRVKISPLAKKTAKEIGIDIKDLSPREPGKRITRADVLEHASTTPAEGTLSSGVPAEEVAERIPLTPTRKVIAERMGVSNQEKPSAALIVSVDASEILQLIDTYKQHGKQVGFSAVIALACAKALKAHPMLNARMGDGAIEVLAHVNVGVAVDGPKGLVVPVIRDTDTKSLETVSAELAEKVAAIRENRSNPDDLSGGTFTVTNLGMFGVESFTAVINPPECAILAVGAVRQVFVPDEKGQPTLHKEMKMTLSFDHRIVDGAPAARFLQDVAAFIENPVLMI